MAFKLTPAAQARLDECKQWHRTRAETFKNLDNGSLVASARLYMSNMTPLHYAPGEPVYDATMWHIILPELLRRIEAQTDAH